MIDLERVPRRVRLGAACLVQLALLGGVLWPQLSARVAGEEYRALCEGDAGSLEWRRMRGEIARGGLPR